MKSGPTVREGLILVVHGAEIFDSGTAGWLIKRLHPARTIVAGVMARTAAEESGLPLEFTGSPPSMTIRPLPGQVAFGDLAKTPESGRIFGNIIASRLEGRGLIQIECSNNTVMIWDEGDRTLASAISTAIGFPCKYLSSTRVTGSTQRKIGGCLPGESVFVNGIIVGRATEGTVVLRSDGSSVEVVSGLDPKEPGLDKLRGSCPDLGAAWCKSGPIRRAAPAGAWRSSVSSGRVAVIDHCGHKIYEAIWGDCCGVLAVGDDTTAVCGHICAHRGIPVLGITDGDLDEALPPAFAPGSVVLETRRERDDDLGKEISSMIGPGPVVWDDWVKEVVGRFGERVRVVIDRREIA